jgi:phosphatidylserine decarboxylase
MRFQTLREARWILLLLFVFITISARINRWLNVIWTAAILGTVYFFRDPNRDTPSDGDAIVAPADGRIVSIEETFESEVLNAVARRVAIFLSVFDVHVNRAPIDGIITYLRSHSGEYLDARHPDATRENAYKTWAFDNPQATLVVRQIAGAVARRIVAWSKVGDKIRKGDHFGMIRFGSRTEVYLPIDCTISVSVGDRVKGGETVIARLTSKRNLHSQAE